MAVTRLLALAQNCDLWYNIAAIQSLMNTFALDTHKTIQELQSRGFSEEQAEGIIEALTESQLVTKSDLVTEFSGLEMRLYRAMLIQTGAITAIVIGILQFAI